MCKLFYRGKVISVHFAVIIGICICHFCYQSPGIVSLFVTSNVYHNVNASMLFLKQLFRNYYNDGYCFLIWLVHGIVHRIPTCSIENGIFYSNREAL